MNREPIACPSDVLHPSPAPNFAVIVGSDSRVARSVGVDVLDAI